MSTPVETPTATHADSGDDATPAAGWWKSRFKPLEKETPLILANDDKMDESVRRARSLNALGQWIGRGFLLLTAILTFLGIKEGELDRIITEQARAALWIFLMIGGGVVLSYVSATLNAEFASPTGYAVLTCTLVGFVTAVILENLDDPNLGFHVDASRLTDVLLLSLLAFGLFFSLISFVAGWRMPVPAAVLLVAVFATVVGLYGVAKLAVVSKGLPDHLHVRAAVTHDGGDAIQVRVTGRDQPDKGIGWLQLDGVRFAQSSGQQVAAQRPIASAPFSQDRTTNIDETFSFPVVLSDWDSFIIQECLGDKDCTPAVVARLPGRRISGPADLSGQILAGRWRTVTITVKGHGVASGTGARVRILRGKGERTLVTSAWVIADGRGNLSWQALAPQGTHGDTIVMRAALCDTPTSCSKRKPPLLATFKVA